MAASSIYSLPLIALIVVVIVVAGVGGALVYLQQHPKPVTPRQTVQVGDNVTVNYIGTFGSGAESGRVFDTSIYSVYVDNVTYPKSLFFPYTHGGSPSNYTALGVHVGPNSPSYTIGSISFVSVVPGFWQGLLGLPVGETRTISVPPALGYGPADPSCFVTKNLTYTVPVYTALNLTAFQTTYPNVTASPGVEFPDPHYGWPVLVLSSNGVTVSVENLPVRRRTVRSVRMAGRGEPDQRHPQRQREDHAREPAHPVPVRARPREPDLGQSALQFERGRPLHRLEREPGDRDLHGGFQLGGDRPDPVVHGHRGPVLLSRSGRRTGRS